MIAHRWDVQSNVEEPNSPILRGKRSTREKDEDEGKEMRKKIVKEGCQESLLWRDGEGCGEEYKGWRKHTASLLEDLGSHMDGVYTSGVHTHRVSMIPSPWSREAGYAPKQKT